MNTVIAVFANGGTMTTTQTALWQYDYGQVLIVQGIQLPTSYEVQFCNAGDSTTITSLGDSDGVVIPDQFLQNGETIYAYIYLHTGPDDGETEYKITIPVMERAEPTDIQPTPQQESTIGQLVSALNDAVSHVDDVADGIPTAIDTALAEAKASGEFDGTNGLDGNRIWYATRNPTGNPAYYTKSDLSGGGLSSPFIADVVIATNSWNVYWLTGLHLSPAGYNTQYLGNIKGANGADGYSPTVTVTEITGGHRVTITDAEGDHTFDVMDGTGGGGGTSDYDDLTNKPQIAGVTLSGNKSLSDLGIAAASDIPTVPVQSVNGKTGAVVLTAADVGAGTYSKPAGGIPASDLASGVIPSVPSASSATPQALGTAAAGSSSAYSRADHVHAKPTAADVGAVAVAQGVSHAGEFVVVGSDGNITTVTMSVWQGGSF